MNRRSFKQMMSQGPCLKIMTEHQIYYETMYILRPDIAEDEVSNHIDKYNTLLKELGATILDSQMRGKRRLAYQIAKHREGIYVQLSHQGDGQHIFKIEKAMRLSDDVIRYMTIKQEGLLPIRRPSNKGSNQKENEEKNNAIDKEKSKADESTNKNTKASATPVSEVKEPVES